MDKVIYTAIFGPYEELKRPKVITQGWSYICFTDQDFTSDVWQIIKVPVGENGPQLTARKIKILPQHFLPNTVNKSIWVDGSFTINCNLDEWWNKRFTFPFTCIKHPIRKCVYEEAAACMKHNRGNVADIAAQAQKYRRLGLPARNGIISSGILMREHKLVVFQFCEKWYQELIENSTRDQLAFAFVAWKNRIHNDTTWDYRNQTEFIFLTHFNRRKNAKSY